MLQQSKNSSRIVMSATLPEDAQRALEAAALRMPDLRPFLAHSPNLTVEGWMELYTVKPLPKVGVAQLLVERHLTREQRLHVFAHEKRPMVFVSLLKHNVLEGDEQELLLNSKGYGQKIASVLAYLPGIRPDLKRRIATDAGGQVFLDFLADSTPETFPADELMELLARFSEWGPSMDDTGRGKSQRAQSLVKLVNRRPELLPTAVASGQHASVVTAAAGCRLLTSRDLQLQVASLDGDGNLISEEEFRDREFALLALVNNPPTDPSVVSLVEQHATRLGIDRLASSAASRTQRRPGAVLVPYEEVSDPEQLKWLVRRALPNEMYNQRARPFDLAALARNPHLERWDFDALANALTTTQSWEALGADLGEVLKVLSERVDDRQKSWLSRWVEERASEDSEDPVRFEYMDSWDKRFTAESMAGRSVRGLVYESFMHQVGQYVASRIGDDVRSWEHLLTLVDEFDGTLDDLLNVSQIL